LQPRLLRVRLNTKFEVVKCATPKTWRVVWVSFDAEQCGGNHKGTAVMRVTLFEFNWAEVWVQLCFMHVDVRWAFCIKLEQKTTLQLVRVAAKFLPTHGPPFAKI